MATATHHHRRKSFPLKGTSPVCQTPSPSPICPSPDSSTTSFENGSNNNGGMVSNIPLCGPFPLAATTSSGSGRITPKFFLTKLTGIPSPGATICSMAPFGTISTMSFGGNSASSSGCSTPTGTTNPIGSLGGGNAALMMDCGVSSSTGGGGTECRDTTMEVSHTVGGNMYEDRSMAVDRETSGSGRTKEVVNSDSIKMACDESETNISDNQRPRRLIIGPSVAISASRELREQVLKSALDPDAAGSCNSNSSNSSSTSSNSSNSSSTTSDSNNSANTNSSRMSSLAGSGPGGNAIDSSSNTSTTSSVDTGGGAAVASGGTAATATICPSLTSFPMMAIPSSLAEIAES
uniref:Uncharacterized protein n=1 Tax=Anopheles minimus TaxID=112268 RepID=A0A182VSE0_9DIPT